MMESSLLSSSTSSFSALGCNLSSPIDLYGWLRVGVTGGVQEFSGNFISEFLGEDGGSLSEHGNVSFARALAAQEVVFFHFILKK